MSSGSMQGLQEARKICCPILEALAYVAGNKRVRNCGLYLGPLNIFLQSHIGLLAPQVAVHCTIMHFIQKHFAESTNS